MRKYMSFITMILVLLSSGAAQMAYHVCEEDGTHIWSNDCNESSTELPLKKGNCCQKAASPQIEKNTCCTEAYLFALSPLPVSPTQFKLQHSTQWFCAAWSRVFEVSISHNPTSNPLATVGEHPPDPWINKPLSDVICVWTI